MNQTHSVNFSNNYKLINFNVPNTLITNFDNVCKFKRFSRTSVLLRLMESFLRDEITKINKDNELTKSFKSIKDKFDNPKKNIKEEPMIPYSSDEEMDEKFWRERLG